MEGKEEGGSVRGEGTNLRLEGCYWLLAGFGQAGRRKEPLGVRQEAQQCQGRYTVGGRHLTQADRH